MKPTYKLAEKSFRRAAPSDVVYHGRAYDEEMHGWCLRLSLASGDEDEPVFEVPTSSLSVRDVVKREYVPLAELELITDQAEKRRCFHDLQSAGGLLHLYQEPV
jgi:hypothetical protein